MPVFKNKVVFEVARGVKAFLNLEVGATRGAVPDGSGKPDKDVQQKLQQAQQRLDESNQKLQKIRQREAEKDQKIAELRAASTPVNASESTSEGLAQENILWIFGSARTGSTWLASMLSEVRGYKLWNEPHVGRLFGQFYYNNEASKRRANERNYIMGSFRDSWLRSIRFFVLDGAAARFQNLGQEGCVVIKEPNASIGAPLLSEALPESRMVLLVRDPRDVVASFLDASREGSWRHQQLLNKSGKDVSKERFPNELASNSANQYVRSMENSKQAYEAHEGPKVLVRYEDLRADPLGAMKRVCEALELGVKDEEVARVVEKHSWENIPDEKKGEGKQHRKASPGGWRDDLSPEQIKIVEETTAPILEEFYPGRG